MIIRDCPNCDGEGKTRYCTHFDRDGNECGYSDTCPTCQGTGEVEEETFPVDEDDDEFFCGWLDFQDTVYPEPCL